MTRQILVATDGSEHADRAVDLAAEIAAKMGGALTILHVLIEDRPGDQWTRLAESEHLVSQAAKQAPKIDYVPGQLANFFDRIQSTEEHDRLVAAMGDLIVERAARRAQKAGAGQAATRVLPGDYATTILETADKIGADMIVMGRRGLGPLKRLMQGSVSRKISDHADCTVVTVH